MLEGRRHDEHGVDIRRRQQLLEVRVGSGSSTLMVFFAGSNWSVNRSQIAVMRARGSAWTMLASYEPRLPTPITPTEIWELACVPRTDCGATMVKAVAPRWRWTAGNYVAMFHYSWR